MRKSAVSKKTAKKEKVPDDKKSTKKGAASRQGSSSSQRNKQNEEALQKQPSNVSKKSNKNVENAEQNDALSAKNVMDNESQENVVQPAPQQEEEQPEQVQEEEKEEVAEQVPPQEEYQADGTALAQEMLNDEEEEKEEIQPPQQVDSPSVRNQNPTPLEDMQSLAGSIQQPNTQNEMFGEGVGLEKALTEKQNEPNDDFDQFFRENQQNIDQFTNVDRHEDKNKNQNFDDATVLSPTPVGEEIDQIPMKEDLDDVFNQDNQLPPQEQEDEDLLQLDDPIESVRPLTLRDDIDYEDNTQFMMKPQNENNLPEGFELEDDLNQDGQIDEIEREIKVNHIKNDMRDQVDENVRNQYLAKFRKEVDFHHKVAYRYEKAYRLGKKQPQKKQALNLEIIDIINEHADYIEEDQMALFYCLYFCVYYNNPDLVEFLRTLINKLQDKPERIDQMLEYIDVNGIERIRTIGEIINTHVYHMVFYQAVDDDLRVVYAQILRQLRFIQLRDKDAQQFLKQRDYEIIRLTFDKMTTKLNMNQFYKKSISLKSQNYRKYTQAFYEEILIDYAIEPRVAQNYRERFLSTAEEIYLVLEMYCKNDYVSHFLKINFEEISHKQFVELFCICLRSDSFKIAMQIYLRFLTNFDITPKIMEILILSLRDSCKFHEMKLFMIHEHFDLLSIEQMNQLVDIYMEILHRKELKLNPMLSQFNTIKYSLLIYRISWKIEQKKIYSLITKCSLLNKYIYNSLAGYLERQQHISQLYKFMREPIFHMTERKDSLDIMLEMNMESLLKHPVIVEVLNLVYEGKYSVDSSALNLSQTFQCFFLMETADLKSINQRIMTNISTFGESGGGKQASLQFNIWKQCIEQRENDEMLFTVLVSCFILLMGLFIDQAISNSVDMMYQIFSDQFVNQPHIFINSDPEKLKEFCPVGVEQMLYLNQILGFFDIVIILACVGYFTAVIQKLTILRIKDNVDIQIGRIFLEISVVLVSLVYIYVKIKNPQNPMVSDMCTQVMEIEEQDQVQINYIYALLSQTDGSLNFQIIISALMVQYSFIMILMLQRTPKLGELIMMVNEMISELRKFIITFGLLIIAFIIVGRQLNREIKMEDSSFFQIILDIFDGLNGKQDFDDFTYPEGKIFITFFVYIFNILLLSFLVAMFINRYKVVFKNLDALRRMNIIKLKNSSSYDKVIGGVSITFFPISIILLPFIPAVLLVKSERLNDFILKMQYAILVLFYCLIAIFLSLPIFPLLYFKIVFNAMYIAMNNKREAYKGQNIVNLIFAIILCPVLIVLSFLVDLLSLPSLLLRDERHFEFKYQQSLEILNESQITVIMTTFAKIFYMNFQQNFAGKGMTLIELMIQHRRIFSLIDNLHDLCCRGTKDYKEALANVQDYNMTKILTRKCSVPDKSGDIKESSCDFSILYCVQMDIELYNYIDILLKDYKSGKLANESQEKRAGGKKMREEEENKDGPKLNAGVVLLTTNTAPAGYSYKRDNADVMNNFFIEIVTRSFTNIEEILKNQRDNILQKKQQETLLELEKVKKTWNTSIYTEVNANFDNYDKTILKSNAIGGPKNPLKEIAPNSDQNLKDLMDRNAKKKESENVLNAINRKASQALNNPDYDEDEDGDNVHNQLDDLLDM